MQSVEPVLASYGATKTAILTMLMRCTIGSPVPPSIAVLEVRTRLGVERVEIGDIGRASQQHQRR